MFRLLPLPWVLLLACLLCLLSSLLLSCAFVMLPTWLSRFGGTHSVSGQGLAPRCSLFLEAAYCLYVSARSVQWHRESVASPGPPLLCQSSAQPVQTLPYVYAHRPFFSRSTFNTFMCCSCILAARRGAPCCAAQPAAPLLTPTVHSDSVGRCAERSVLRAQPVPQERSAVLAEGLRPRVHRALQDTARGQGERVDDKIAPNLTRNWDSTLGSQGFPTDGEPRKGLVWIPNVCGHQGFTRSM